jgi:hypothetical protein
MTGRDLQVRFCRLLQSNGIDPIIKSSDIYSQLNIAQEKLVMQLSDAYSKSQVVTDELRFLTRAVTITTKINTTKASIYEEDSIELPENYRLFLSASAALTYKPLVDTIVYTVNSSQKRVATCNNSSPTIVLRCFTTSNLIKLYALDDINRAMIDPFNRTNVREPIGYILDNKLNILTTNFVVDAVRLNYIAQPPIIDISTIVPLSDSMVETLVNDAVSNYRISFLTKGSPNKEPLPE